MSEQYPEPRGYEPYYPPAESFMEATGDTPRYSSYPDTSTQSNLGPEAEGRYRGSSASSSGMADVSSAAPGTPRYPVVPASALQYDSSQDPRLMPAAAQNLMPVWITVVITLLFTVFGVIPAYFGEKQLQEANQPGGRHWRAFAITLVLMIVAWGLLTLLSMGLIFSMIPSEETYQSLYSVVMLQL